MIAQVTVAAIMLCFAANSVITRYLVLVERVRTSALDHHQVHQRACNTSDCSHFCVQSLQEGETLDGATREGTGKEAGNKASS